MGEPFDIPNIRIITVSGRIASGSTTLAKKLAEKLSWRHIEGGEVFWESIRRKMGLSAQDTNLRPDQEDELFDSQLKKILHEENHIILETKLAGFNAKGIPNVFKICVICENVSGKDQAEIRIDRLVNREGLSMDKAKEEVLKREKNDIEKWRKLYAKDDPSWVYWDPKYYDLVINTYSHNQDETLRIALDAFGVGA